jgi:HAD superfamily hydrolase (TIGR01459 family)
MTPPIIAEAGPLLGRYEAVFCDVWGVVHDGRNAYPEAGEAMARFRAAGGTVILVSNVPLPKESVEHVLAKTRVRRDAWDAIVAGGDIALDHIAARGYRRLHWVGDLLRDAKLFARVAGSEADIEAAEAILCSGFVDDLNDTVDDYRPMLETALARGLEFVCANPDLVVDVGERRHLCAGTLAAEYERLGGAVYWAGKPHPSAYATALARTAALRGYAPPLARVLAIGDAVRTDLAAAQGLGVDALLIAAGLHREELMVADGTIDPARLAHLFAHAGIPPAIAAMPYLRW